MEDTQKRSPTDVQRLEERIERFLAETWQYVLTTPTVLDGAMGVNLMMERAEALYLEHQDGDGDGVGVVQDVPEGEYDRGIGVVIDVQKQARIRRNESGARELVIPLE